MCTTGSNSILLHKFTNYDLFGADPGNAFETSYLCTEPEVLRASGEGIYGGYVAVSGDLVR